VQRLSLLKLFDKQQERVSMKVPGVGPAETQDPRDQLQIVHVYIDFDFGKETLAILDQQAARYGFAVQHLAVQPPGLDQKETWRRV
jgi:hypothetical protein